VIIPNNVEEIQEFVGKEATVFYFTAGWCPDCTFIKPFLPEIEAEFPEFTFVEVDRDKHMDLGIEWNIFGIPSFVVTKNGVEVGRLVNKARKTKEEVSAFLKDLV